MEMALPNIDMQNPNAGGSLPNLTLQNPETGEYVDVQMQIHASDEASAAKAEAWAVGERGGVPVSNTDQTYHNNAKYYAQVAEDAAETASAAYGTDLLAPTYSASKTYAIGDHVIYNGGYYACNTAITTAEAWTAAHWTKLAVGEEVTDLKSALRLNDKDQGFIQYLGENWTKTQASGTINKKENNTFVLSGSHTGSYRYVLLSSDSGSINSSETGFSASELTIPVTTGHRYRFIVEKLSDTSMTNQNVHFALLVEVNSSVVIQSGATISMNAFVNDVTKVEKEFVAQNSLYGLVFNFITTAYSGTFRCYLKDITLETTVSDIANDIVDVHGNIDEIQEMVGHVEDISNNVTFTNGYAIYYNSGSAKSSSILAYSNYIEIPDWANIIELTTVIRDTNSDTGLAYYDSTKTYISGIRDNYDEDETGLYPQTIRLNVPQNAKYFRTNWIASNNPAYSSYTFLCKLIQSGVFIEDDADYVYDVIGKRLDISKYPRFQTGYGVYYNTGHASGSTVASASNYVPIPDGYNKMEITLLKRPTDVLTGIAFFSNAAEADYISGVKNPIDTSLSGYEQATVVIDIPQGATFFRTTWLSVHTTGYSSLQFHCYVYRTGELEETMRQSAFVNTWDDYFDNGSTIDEKVEEYSELFLTGTDIESFMFFTDSHITGLSGWKKTYRNMLKVMGSVYKSAPLDFCVYGGDVFTASSSIASVMTPAEAMYYMNYHDKMCRSVFGDDCYLPMVGNHEYNYYNTDYEPLTDDDITNCMFRKWGREYYSYKGNNTTIYVLNTGRNADTEHGYNIPMNEYKWTQIDWLANELLTNDPTHSIIAMHIIRNNNTDQPEFLMFTNANELAAAYNARGNITMNGITYDFSDCTGKVELFIGGHLHGDGYNIVKNGIPCIMRANTLESPFPTFDMVFCDWNNEKVYFKRIGNGSDLTVDINNYDPS